MGKEVLFEHDRFLNTTTLNEEQKAELLQIINDTITEGIKIANNLDYKMLEDFSDKWDYIDKRKLRFVKRLASFVEDSMASVSETPMTYEQAKTALKQLSGTPDHFKSAPKKPNKEGKV